MVNAPFAYKIILGLPSINKLGAVVLTMHLKLKYPLDDGTIDTIKIDQAIAQK